MNYQLREYINTLFQEAPPTKKTVELKEEILQNLTDKYNDLIAEGKSEEAAYNIAVASIGDLSHLINELKTQPELTEEQTKEAEEYKKRKAIITATSVALYILCSVPVIAFGRTAGYVLMMVMIAAATGMLIYNNMTKPHYMKADDSMAEEFRAWRETSSDKRSVYRSLCLALWALTVVLYFLISFSFNHWHLTWLLFPLAGAINAILKAVFDLRK